MGLIWDIVIKLAIVWLIVVVISTILAVVPCPIIIGALLLIGIFYLYDNYNNTPTEEG